MLRKNNGNTSHVSPNCCLPNWDFFAWLRVKVMKHRNPILFVLIVLLGTLSFLWWKPIDRVPPTLESPTTEVITPLAASPVAGAASSHVAVPMSGVVQMPEEVKTFRDWAKAYLGATPAEQKAMEAQ